MAENQPEVTVDQILNEKIVPVSENIVPVGTPITKDDLGSGEPEENIIFHNSILGIDFGCSKIVTSLIHHHSKFPFVVRNETQDLYTVNLIGFKDKQRLVGVEAMGEAQLRPQNCVEKINLLLSNPPSGTLNEPVKHGSLPVTFLASEQEQDTSSSSTPSRIELLYNGNKDLFYSEQLYSMVLNTIQSHCRAANSEFENAPVPDCYIHVPEDASSNYLYSINSAAALSKLNVLGFVPTSLALTMAYALKHPKDISEEGKEKNILFVDMGESTFTLFVSKFSKDKGEVVDTVSIPVGGSSFDSKLFQFCQQYILNKHQEDASKNWRLCRRLYIALVKAKILLSTIPQTEIALSIGEHDIRIPITRSQLQDLCSEELKEIQKTITEFQKKHTGLNLECLEIVGGATRMPFLQTMIETSINNITVRHTLDSDLDVSLGTSAIGASRNKGYQVGIQCYHPNIEQFEIDITNGHTLSEDQIKECILIEGKMVEIDIDIKARSTLRNQIEALYFDMKGVLGNSKFDDVIDDKKKKSEYDEYLDSIALWLEDCSDFEKVVLEEKLKEFLDTRQTLLPKLDAKLKEIEIEKAKLAAEAAAKSLEEQGQAVKSTRRDRPQTNKERLESAKDKKEKGTTHFVNIDYPAAVKRYSQALEDLASMFDETPEQLDEKKALQLACYLNIAQCLLKVSAWDKAIDNCRYALGIDPDNTKALFRRGSAYFSKKEYELAKTDLARAAELQPQDKSIKALLAKTDHQINLQKEKEKKMYAAMFS